MEAAKQKPTLAWDLSQGKASAMETDQSGEIQIVAGPTWGKQVGESNFPYVYTDGEAQDWVLDVWGLDRRMALVWAHYLKPAAWWTQFGAFIGGPRPAPKTEITIQAVLIVQDALGSIREIGPYPNEAWLNGGEIDRDGIEILSGAQGVRFKVHAIFHGFDAWDFAAKLVLKPDVVFGCDGLGAAVAAGYHAPITAQLNAAQFTLDDS